MTGTSARETLQGALAGRYTIHEAIGSGGMGMVYRATDLRHDRVVAIKVIRPEVVSAALARRFLREISIVAGLTHPNIVPLFDSGDAGGELYYVMPFIEGSSVRARVRDEIQLPIDEAIRVTAQVGEALTYAHANGVLHRDIKPDNILLRSGNALVTDFGVARALSATRADAPTTTDVPLGTPLYMSPEQADGDPRVDARSDQYSLAMVLFEMLAGQPPFHARTVTGMTAQKRTGEHPALRTFRPKVPAHVAAAIDRALQPIPGDRFDSVADFVAALDEGNVVALRRRYVTWRRVAFVAIAAAAASGALVAMQRRSAPPRGVGRIVVAPLENRTGDTTLDALGLVAADWLTEGLERTRAAEVVPTPSVFQASRQVGANKTTISTPARAIAQETGARTVVNGAYYRQGDSLIFRISVADRSGGRLAAAFPPVSTALDAPMSGLQTLRDRLMGWVALQYDDHGPEEAGTAEPPTYEAYHAFSDGMDRYIAQQNLQAVPLFLHAYELDTSFVPALLYASFALTNTGAWASADSLLSIVDRRRDQLTAYNRAWLDYRLAFVRGQPDRTLAAIREAARIAPDSKAVYNLAVTAFQTGHVHEALTAIRSLSPDRGAMRGYVPYWWLESAILHALGRYEAERSSGESARAAFPDRLGGLVPLARAFATAGDMTALSRLVDEARSMPPDPYLGDYSRLLSEIAEELRAHGRPAEAAKYGDQLIEWVDSHGGGPSDEFRLVQTAYAMGRYDLVRSHLARLRAAEPLNVDYLGTAGLLYARTGRADAAKAIDDSLAKRAEPYLFGLPAAYRARLAAIRGDSAAAVAALEQAFGEALPYQLWLHRDVDLMPLRGYAPFERLVRGKD